MSRTRGPIVNGTALKKIRLEKGFDHEDLSTKSGVSTRTLVNYESGGWNANIKELKNIAKALEISVDAIIEKPSSPGAPPTASQSEPKHYSIRVELEGEGTESEEFSFRTKLGELCKTHRIQIRDLNIQFKSALIGAGTGAGIVLLFVKLVSPIPAGGETPVDVAEKDTERSENAAIRIKEGVSIELAENSSYKKLADAQGEVLTIDLQGVGATVRAKPGSNPPDTYLATGHGVRIHGTVFAVDMWRQPCSCANDQQIQCDKATEPSARWITGGRVTVRQGVVTIGRAELDPVSKKMRFLDEKRDCADGQQVGLRFNDDKACVLKADASSGPVDIVMFKGFAPVIIPRASRAEHPHYALRDAVDITKLLQTTISPPPTPPIIDGGLWDGSTDGPGPEHNMVLNARGQRLVASTCTYQDAAGKTQSVLIKNNTVYRFPEGTFFTCTTKCTNLAGGPRPTNIQSFSWGKDEPPALKCK